MTKSVETAFNRSLTNILEPYKLMITGGVLFLLGFITAIFAAFAHLPTSLMQRTLFLIPIFLGLGFLLSLGSFLCKLYIEETEQGEIVRTFKAVWMRLLGATYFSLPFLGAFFILWIMIGVFELLTLTPFVGTLFSTIFAFIPFILNLSLFLLIIGGFFSLFILAPLLAVENEMNFTLIEKARSHFMRNPFRNCLLFLVAIIPAILVLILAWLTLSMGILGYDDLHPMILILQNVSLAIPLALIFILPTIFFFQFAIESFRAIE